MNGPQKSNSEQALTPTSWTHSIQKAGAHDVLMWLSDLWAFCLFLFTFSLRELCSSSLTCLIFLHHMPRSCGLFSSISPLLPLCPFLWAGFLQPCSIFHSRTQSPFPPIHFKYKIICTCPHDRLGHVSTQLGYLGERLHDLPYKCHAKQSSCCLRERERQDKAHIAQTVQRCSIFTRTGSHVVGASDDAVSCAVMLEVLHSLANQSTPLHHGVVFLFNGAEENVLQVKWQLLFMIPALDHHFIQNVSSVSVFSS